MIIYLSGRQISDKLSDMYRSDGHRHSISEAAQLLAEEKAYSFISPNPDTISQIIDAPFEEFPSRRLDLCWEFDTNILHERYLMELDPDNRREDYGWSNGYPAHVFLDNVYYKEYSELHSDDKYFECNYIYQGSCDFYHEKQRRELITGDLCIISPNAMHEIRPKTPDTFLIQVRLNYKTFSSAFLSLLSEDNILSNFFRAVLLNKDQANYLLLSTGESREVHKHAMYLYLEFFRFDEYAPQCTADRTRLLFANILRRIGKNYRFAGPNEGIEFGPIIKYLNTNYRTASLSDVASYFHYSTSYLSVMIKRATGKTYTELIRELKMTDASNYLETTKKSIEEIATLTGYNSADQFTRAFRSYYQVTPSAYRKAHSGVR